MSGSAFETVEFYNDGSDFKHGDVVKLYKTGTKLDYPCIVLETDKLETFRVNALKGILGRKSLLPEDTLYNLYVSLQGQLIKIGQLQGIKLKLLLQNKVFEVFKKRAHLDGNTTIEGDMLWALCLTTSIDSF